MNKGITTVEIFLLLILVIVIALTIKIVVFSPSTHQVQALPAKITIFWDPGTGKIEQFDNIQNWCHQYGGLTFFTSEGKYHTILSGHIWFEEKN